MKYRVTLRRTARAGVARLAERLAGKISRSGVDVAARDADELDAKLLALAAAAECGASDLAKALLTEAGFTGDEIRALAEAGVVPSLNARQVAALLLFAVRLGAGRLTVSLGELKAVYDYVSEHAVVAATWLDVVALLTDLGLVKGSEDVVSATPSWRLIDPGLPVSPEFYHALRREAAGRVGAGRGWPEAHAGEP